MQIFRQEHGRDAEGRKEAEPKEPVLRYDKPEGQCYQDIVLELDGQRPVDIIYPFSPGKDIQISYMTCDIAPIGMVRRAAIIGGKGADIIQRYHQHDRYQVGRLDADDPLLQ